MRLSTVAINLLDNSGQSSRLSSISFQFQFWELAAVGLPISVPILKEMFRSWQLRELCLWIVHYVTVDSLMGCRTWWFLVPVGSKCCQFSRPRLRQFPFLTPSWGLTCHAISLTENVGHFSLKPLFVLYALARVLLWELVVAFWALSSGALNVIFPAVSCSLQL